MTFLFNRLLQEMFRIQVFTLQIQNWRQLCIFKRIPIAISQDFLYLPQPLKGVSTSLDQG